MKRLTLALLVMSLCAVSSGLWRAGGAESAGSNQNKKDKTAGTPVLWSEPANIESLDMFYGSGGREGAPDPQDRFTFLRRSKGGTSEKIIVRDQRGREWTVKFGPEARPETAASRIVWAAGYHTDDVYFVKQTRVEGRGDFDVYDVRFERRDTEFKELDIWSWTASPFNGTRELNGLKTLMAVLNNWDIKDENNKIVRPQADRTRRIYYVSDLGATFGSTGSFFRKLPFFGDAPAGSKGEPESYANQAFIVGAVNGEVQFNYKGKNRDALKGIPTEHARWMGNLLGRLSDKQLTDAFRASGFSDDEVNTLVSAIRNRIDQLKALK